MNANEISPKATDRLDRIKKVSRFFRAVFLTATLFSAVIGLWVFGVMVNFVSEDWRAHIGVLIYGGLSAGLNFVNTVWLWLCYRLFGLYSRGDLFTAEVVCSIRRIGILYFFIILGRFLCRWITPHLANSPHWVEVMNSVWSVIAGSFLGFLILFIAWIMDEGRKIQEEQELTV